MTSSNGNGWLFGGALASSLIGAASNALSSRKQYEYQKRLMEETARTNYNYNYYYAHNVPSWSRAGFEKAGYNPMLAVQNGTSGANASFTSSGNAVAPDYTGGMSAGISNVLNFKRLENETKTTEAQNDESYANADKAKAEKASIMQKLPFIGQREKAEIANIEKDSMRKEAMIHNIEETTRFIEKDFELRRRLGEMGIDVQRYGINQAYNATKYSSDKSYDATKYATDKGTPPKWVSGVGAALGAGIGMYGAIRGFGNKGSSVSHSSNYGWYVHRNH